MQRKAVAALFFVSGFSSLGYQIVWQRILTQEIGGDSISIAFIVAIFMCGLGIGSYGHRLVNGLRLEKKRFVYVGLEIFIGTFGWFSVDLIRSVNQSLVLGSAIEAQFAVNLMLLSAPTLCMGLTTPLILDLIKARDEYAGRSVGLLYGVNVMGAALGAMITGLALIELFGLRGVSHMCAAVNLALAALFWVALREVNGPGSKFGPARPGAWRFTVAAIAFGYASMAMQMIYFRTAFNHFLLYSFIFPFMLGIFLLAMSMGQFIFGYISDVCEDRDLSLNLAALFLAVSLGLTYRLPLEWLQPLSFSGYLPRFALFTLVFAVPVAIGSGMFTLLVRHSAPDGRRIGSSFGNLMAAASLGNTLGAFTTPVFLFQAVGTMGALRLTAFLYIAASIASTASGKLRHLSLVALASFLAAFLGLPSDYFEKNRMFTIGVSASRTTEDEVGIVNLFKHERGTSIQVFRTPTSTIFSHYDGTYDMHPLNSLLSADDARMLIIGMGGCNYLPNLVNNPRIKHVTLVEISSAVMDGVMENSTLEIKAALNSPKVRLVVGDGRRFVKEAVRRGETFDIIENGVFQPWMSGSGNLYTTEFVKAVYDILTPDGIYVTLDLERIAQSVSPVFTHAYSAPAENNRYIYFKKVGGGGGGKPIISMAYATETCQGGTMRSIPMTDRFWNSGCSASCATVWEACWLGRLNLIGIYA
jgi:predicted membrane-bound spermidine synthase